jgi:hypothetical protein
MPVPRPTPQPPSSRPATDTEETVRADLFTLLGAEAPQSRPSDGRDEATATLPDAVPPPMRRPQDTLPFYGDSSPKAPSVVPPPSAVPRPSVVPARIVPEPSNVRIARAMHAAEFGDAPLAIRLATAQSGGPDAIAALCTDDARVVHEALLARADFAPSHRAILARFIGSATLPAFVTRGGGTIDPPTLLDLLANPILSVASLAPQVGGWPLGDLYKLVHAPELDTAAILRARSLFAAVFVMSDVGDQLAVLLTYDGAPLACLPADHRLPEALYLRVVALATLPRGLIVALAGHRATPAAVLARLAELPRTRKDATIRDLLGIHPSTPSDVRAFLGALG